MTPSLSDNKLQKTQAGRSRRFIWFPEALLHPRTTSTRLNYKDYKHTSDTSYRRYPDYQRLHYDSYCQNKVKYKGQQLLEHKSHQNGTARQSRNVPGKSHYVPDKITDYHMQKKKGLNLFMKTSNNSLRRPPPAEPPKPPKLTKVSLHTSSTTITTYQLHTY